MDKWLHPLQSVGWNCSSFFKLQRLYSWSLGMDKYFHSTLYWACGYLPMLGWNLHDASKRGTRPRLVKCHIRCYSGCWVLQIIATWNERTVAICCYLDFSCNLDFCSVDPFCCDAGVSRQYVNTIAVDALILFVAKPLASMLLSYAEWQGLGIFCLHRLGNN